MMWHEHATATSIPLINPILAAFQILSHTHARIVLPTQQFCAPSMATMKSPSANPGCPGRGSTDWTRMPQSSSKRRSSVAPQRARDGQDRKTHWWKTRRQKTKKQLISKLIQQISTVYSILIDSNSLNVDIQCVKGSKPVLPGSRCRLDHLPTWKVKVLHNAFRYYAYQFVQTPNYRTHMKEGEWWVAKLQCFHHVSSTFKCSPSTSFNLGVRNPSAHNSMAPAVPLPCASTARRTLRAVYTGFSRAAACWFQLGSSHSGASFQRPGRPLHRIKSPGVTLGQPCITWLMSGKWRTVLIDVCCHSDSTTQGHLTVANLCIWFAIAHVILKFLAEQKRTKVLCQDSKVQQPS